MLPLPGGDSHTWEALEGGKGGGVEGGEGGESQQGTPHVRSVRFPLSEGLSPFLWEIRVQSQETQRQHPSPSLVTLYPLYFFFLSHLLLLLLALLLKSESEQKRKCGPLLGPVMTLWASQRSFLLRSHRKHPTLRPHPEPRSLSPLFCFSTPLQTELGTSPTWPD